MFKNKNAEKIILGLTFGSLIILLVVAMRNDMISAAEHRARESESLKERVITLNPRPGVECYVLPGGSSVNPRTMSCVTISRD